MTRREWLATAATSPLAAQAPDIDHFFDDFLMQWVKADPEMATNMRLFPAAEQERLDSQLSDVSDAALEARISRAREGLRGLARFDRARLTPAQQFSADMFEYLLNDVIAEQSFLAYRFPLNQFTGVQVRLPTLFTDIHPLRTRRDAENYLARLDAFGGKIDQAAKSSGERAARGIRLPAFLLVETGNQMKRFTTPAPEKNILATSFADRLTSISALTPDDRATMSATALRLISEKVYPAYRRAADGLASQLPKASDDAGLWRLPKGDEAYAFYLRRFTTTSLTPDAIHKMGLSEVKRIEAEMDGLLKQLGYSNGPVNDRMRQLEDASVYPDSPGVRDKVLADFASIIDEANRRSAEAFDRRPKAPCIVQRIPEFQEANAAANYSQPPRDGSRPGIFRVPLPGPRFNRPRMRSLAYHEAIPGHHFQLALQVEMNELPQFRRSSPFGPMSAFSEGWALYAERLASDLGWYKGDAAGDLGRLASELFRARRLVVDTGIHAQRWTRQQSIDYGIPRSEVDRYVVMPGQACSYKIGQMKILELRDRARRELGERFSLKQFHNTVLSNGSIPLTLLERTVAAWIKA